MLKLRDIKTTAKRKTILGFRSSVVKVRTDLVPVTGVPVKQAACFFFINLGALSGEVEMDSVDCAIAVAINNNNSYEAKAGIREKSS